MGYRLQLTRRGRRGSGGTTAGSGTLGAHCENNWNCPPLFARVLCLADSWFAPVALPPPVSHSEAPAAASRSSHECQEGTRLSRLLQMSEVHRKVEPKPDAQVCFFCFFGCCCCGEHVETPPLLLTPQAPHSAPHPVLLFVWVFFFSFLAPSRSFNDLPPGDLFISYQIFDGVQKYSIGS